MQKLFIAIVKFSSTLIAIFIVLGLIDLFWYDRISNEYLMKAIKDEDVKTNVFIGSSKMKWSTIDTLFSDATFVAEGGQFAYASIAALMKLAENDLLSNRKIFIDLEESDEIASGFGQWWYFSEAFIEYRYARMSDYTLSEMPAISARIVRDLAHFGPNPGKTFSWKPLENSIGHFNEHPDLDSIQYNKTSFESCSRPFSKPYANCLARFAFMVKDLEKKHNCKIFIVLPPYPKRGCLNAYKLIFGEEKVWDMSKSVQFEMDDFNDNSHLNSHGAFKLSKAFSQQINQLN